MIILPRFTSPPTTMGLQAYIVFLLALVLITTSLAYRAFVERQRPGARTFGLLMASMGIWSLFYLLEIVSPGFQQKILARKILYLGMTMTPPLWLGFALRYTIFSKWWGQRGRIALLMLPGLALFLLGLTNERHHLLWWSLAMPAAQGMGALRLTHGIAFWGYTIIAYTMIAAGFVIYTSIHFRSPKYLRKQTSAILLGATFATTTNLLALTGVLPADIDFTPLSFAFAAPLLALGFFRFGLFNLFPIAAPVIIENLHEAVIVVDEYDHITKINLAAKKWFDLPDRAVGAIVFDVLPKASLFRIKWSEEHAKLKFKVEQGEKRAAYDATITRLYKGDATLLGRVIIIHDMTHEQDLLEAEFRHSVQMGLLEEVGRRISGSLTEKEILEQAVEAVIHQFGYAECAVSLLTEAQQLEVVAIAGVEDFGYNPSFTQPLGTGIIGHTALIKKTYLANEVAKDPYYFSNQPHDGSALCVPLFNDENTLLGVFYVESLKSHDFRSEDIQTLETLAYHISSAMQRARLYENMRAHLQVLSAVQSISQVVSSSLDLERIHQSVVDALKSSFGYSHISIYLLKDEYLHLGAQFGYSAEKPPARIHIHEGISGRTVQTRKTQFVANIATDPDFLCYSEDVGSEICVPILKEDTILGTLNVESTTDSPLTQADADMLTMLAGPIALAVDNARLHLQVKITAITDAVTGLHNRHAFERALHKEIERATRSNKPLSLIIFDMDSFKEYNDTWGHPAGDERLKAMAAMLRESLREYDIAARYGGDEFAVILPDTDRRGARMFATRLLKAARANAPNNVPKNTHIAGHTLSIGIATFPKDGASLNSLLIAADHAELIAKKLGKNRIVTARELKK